MCLFLKDLTRVPDGQKKVKNCFCLKNNSLLNLVLHPLTHPSTYHGQSSFRNVKNWLQVGTLSTFLISFNDFMSICFTICLILINPLWHSLNLDLTSLFCFFNSLFLLSFYHTISVCLIFLFLFHHCFFGMILSLYNFSALLNIYEMSAHRTSLRCTSYWNKI